jgi:ABC-2 type transport system ATP-binding protein
LTYAIEIEGLSKRFGATQCLDGLTLSVESGTLFGFLGPNGAGKTTTLRTMLGLVRPDHGSISVLGRDPRVDPTAIRQQTGVLLESDGLYDRVSAQENLEFHARIYRLGDETRRHRIRELLTAFGLAGRGRDAVGTWSRGMRQKLAIARALLHRPRVLLLDEPFAGLDPAAAVELRESLVALVSNEGTTLFLTSHDLGHVEKACSRVAVIQAGHVLATGAPSELARGSSDIEVEITGAGLSDEVLSAMSREQLVLSYSLQGGHARVTCTPEARPRLAAELMRRGVVIEEVHTKRTSLEEAFLALVRPTKAEG